MCIFKCSYIRERTQPSPFIIQAQAAAIQSKEEEHRIELRRLVRLLYKSIGRWIDRYIYVRIYTCVYRFPFVLS